MIGQPGFMVRYAGTGAAFITTWALNNPEFLSIYESFRLRLFQQAAPIGRYRQGFWWPFATAAAEKAATDAEAAVEEVKKDAEEAADKLKAAAGK